MRGFVVILSNGETISELEMTWIQLKEYIKIKGLRIAEMRLQFDHQQVCLPNYARAYFYSKKVEAYLGGRQVPSQYYGVGATESSHEEVVITWYDGDNSQAERRAVEDIPAFIIA